MFRDHDHSRVDSGRNGHQVCSTLIALSIFMFVKKTESQGSKPAESSTKSSAAQTSHKDSLPLRDYDLGATLELAENILKRNHASYISHRERRRIQS